jgi:membrane fusion protein, multidrug efflux system
LLPDPTAQVVVPEGAITYTLYGNSVYAVAEKKAEDGTPEKDANGQPVLIAERRFVETGERRAGLVLVSKGLKAGEQVVSAGQLKLDNGTPIAISPDKNLPAGH